MRGVLAVGFSIVALSSGAALAQSSGALTPEQVVAIRKSLMDLQQGNVNAMKAAVDAKADVKQFKFAAQALAASSKVIVSLFPTGTEKVGGTKAKPNIWSDNAGFAKDAQTLQEAAAKLVSLADQNDKEGFAAQFAETGKACGACHREYRERE